MSITKTCTSQSISVETVDHQTSRLTLTFLSHLRSSSCVQISGSPLGSGSEGNMLPDPQIVHAATAVTMPAKPSVRFF
jgi:hypothetical protein